METNVMYFVEMARVRKPEYCCIPYLGISIILFNNNLIQITETRRITDLLIVDSELDYRVRLFGLKCCLREEMRVIYRYSFQ